MSKVIGVRQSKIYTCRSKEEKGENIVSTLKGSAVSVNEAPQGWGL